MTFHFYISNNTRACDVNKSTIFLSYLQQVLTQVSEDLVQSLICKIDITQSYNPH